MDIDEKHVYEIELVNGGRTGLDAIDVLAQLEPNQGLHDIQNQRPPKGIYNTSILRVSERLYKCCEKYYEYFNYAQSIKKLKEVDVLKNEAINCLEHALYAAAEQVDDIKLIVNGFFNRERKSKALKQFKNELSDQRKLITIYVNQIKHYQARLRGFSLELIYGEEHLCLHGVFLEGLTKGVIGPNNSVHDERTEVISVTTLIWEIICFVLNTSRALSQLLVTELGITPVETLKFDCEQFRKAVLAAGKLPIYTFDDMHPLSLTRLRFKDTNSDSSCLESNLLGSIHKGWPKDNIAPTFLRSEVSYVGDGVSASFKTVSPSNVGFIHWIDD